MLKNKRKILSIIAIIFVMTMFISYNVFFRTTNVQATSRYGSTGSEVTQIQTKLKRWGYYKGAVDGVYGSKTLAAVKWFQSKNGLTADGIAGTKTLRAMGIYSNTGTGSSSTNSNDVNLLARLVYGEARGEPYEGQVAVGAVILNRVKSSQFPNTIAGVIYQSGAFTAVSDGQINQPIAEGSTVYKAAQDAKNGWDPTGGCIYYFNPATATNKWIWSRPLVKTIGKHRFCK